MDDLFMRLTLQVPLPSFPLEKVRFSGRGVVPQSEWINMFQADETRHFGGRWNAFLFNIRNILPLSFDCLVEYENFHTRDVGQVKSHSQGGASQPWPEHLNRQVGPVGDG